MTEDSMHASLDAALARNSGPSAEDVEALAGVGAWANHDDPRDEWPTAADWNLPGLAGILADAEDEFWTHYHRVCEERGEAAGDTIGTSYDAMARRILTGPELADLLAAAEARGAERERQQAARIIAEQVKDCRRAGGGIYTADFIAGLAWANALIADQGGA
jgi:hypothetical protein